MRPTHDVDPTPDPRLGQRVAGYELIARVANGPIAALYRGVADGVHAAVKIVPPGERDEREARAQRAIEHPCVARGLGAVRLPDGALALVSEWIEGPSLEGVLRSGPLPWSTIVAILRDLARGLGAIHGAGVVHRDLKPSNVILPLDDARAAVIVDFGHALMLDDARLTGSGLVLGSAHYMAPEQAQGLALDRRADLYALGVVLYRMLTGVVPFDHAAPAEVMRMHQQEPVVPPGTRRPGIPPAAEDLCLWLLTKDRERRVPNAHVLRLTLDALERGDAVGISAAAEQIA